MLSKIINFFGKGSSTNAEGKSDSLSSPTDANDQYNLGYQYVTGDGRKKDLPEGLKWIERAAEQKFPEALFHMGAMYHHGQGTPQDYSKASKYYLAAAEQEHPKAQNNLAVLYSEGLGVPADLSEAYKWFQMASKNGHPTASQSALLTEMKMEMADENTQINLTIAQASLNQEAKMRQLHSSANRQTDQDQHVVSPTMRFGQLPDNELANFQSARDIVFNEESDQLLEARDELTRLYSAGYGEAFSVLGYMAVVYAGDEDDLTDGLKILHKCSDAGDSGSTCLLGNIYEKGQTVEQNLAKAWHYYGKAIEQGSVAALSNKGVMAIQGRGGTKDVELGMSLLREAHKKGSTGAQELLKHFNGKQET